MGKESTKFGPIRMSSKKADSLIFEYDVIIEPDKIVLVISRSSTNFERFLPVRPMWQRCFPASNGETIELFPPSFA